MADKCVECSPILCCRQPHTVQTTQRSPHSSLLVAQSLRQILRQLRRRSNNDEEGSIGVSHHKKNDNGHDCRTQPSPQYQYQYNNLLHCSANVGLLLPSSTIFFIIMLLAGPAGGFLPCFREDMIFQLYAGRGHDVGGQAGLVFRKAKRTNPLLDLLLGGGSGGRSSCEMEDSSLLSKKTTGLVLSWCCCCPWCAFLLLDF